MRQLNKFLSLSTCERFLLGQAFLSLALVRLGMWILPFRWFKPLVHWIMTGVYRKESTPLISAAQVVKCIDRATRYSPGKTKCLARALTAKLLLQHYGYPCTLSIGVAKSGSQQPVAHAWIEHNGQVLIGGNFDLSMLTPLPPIVN